MALVLVETIVMSKRQYVVETPDDHPEYALDTVTCKEADEMSVEFLDEVIVSHRKVSKRKYVKLFDRCNMLLTHLTDREKLEYVTRINP